MGNKNKEAEESHNFKHLLSAQHKDRQEKSLPANRAHFSASVFPYASPPNAYLEGIKIQPLICTCDDGCLELVEIFWQHTSISSWLVSMKA